MDKEKQNDKCKDCKHLINNKCDIKGQKGWQCVLGKVKFTNGPRENIYG
jgi:hypothetical protein